MADALGYSVMLGFGKRMHEANQLREEHDWQQQQQADAEDRAHYDFILNHLSKMADDPTNLDDARAAAAKNMMLMVSRGRQQVKPKEREQLLAEPANAAKAARARDLLGLSTGAKTVADNASSLVPDQLPMGDAISQGIQQGAQQASDTAAAQVPNVSSDTHYTPQEHIQNMMKLMQTIGGGSSGNSGMDMRLNAAGEPSFAPKHVTYTTEQQRYRDATGTEHTGTVWIDHDSHTAYAGDPTQGGQQPVALLSKEATDRPVAVTRYVNGKKVISWENRSGLAGQSIEQEAPNHTIVEPDSSGNLHRRTYAQRFGQPDQLLGDEVVGKNPLVDLQKEHMANSITLQRNQILNDHEKDFLVQEENRGAVIPAQLLPQVAKRRAELEEQGNGEVAAFPDKYSATAQTDIRGAVRVLSTTDRIKKVIETSLQGQPPSNVPYSHAAAVIAYGLGLASPVVGDATAADELNRHIADLSILSLNSAASIGIKGSRNYKYLMEQRKHTPDPTKDSMQLILDKLRAIEDLNNEVIVASRDTGLKSGVINLPGDKPRPTLPARRPVTTTPTGGGGGGKPDANAQFDSIFNLITQPSPAAPTTPTQGAKH